MLPQGSPVFTANQSHHPILLYDGVCGFCNRLVQFILRHDSKAVFRFASLQSPLAVRILTRNGANPTDIDTFYLVLSYNEAGERLLPRSDAVIYVLGRLGGVWRGVAVIVGVLPRFLRDWVYNTIARNRYRIFGRYDTCPIPSEETRERFLDL
jgi:predicted DCC family thiol-disulfide oxidoreductase YuxK